MIESLEIQNFQSWEKIKLNFSQGLNIIVGQSDKGKSSIFRALNWICNNRPTGNSFRSNFTKEKTTAVLELDGQKICRKKSININSYNINNSPENLQALRSDVPDEIKNITQMGEINFQPQNENFFLLNETPGKVAKKFNEIAGLEIMDKSLTSINSLLRESKQDLKTTDKNIEGLSEKIKDLNWIESCNEQYIKIEKQKEILQSSKEDLDIIEDLIIKYDNILFESSKLPDSKALPKIESIFKKDDELYNIEKEINTMDKLLTECVTVEKKIKRISLLDKAKLTTVNEHTASIDRSNNQILKITNLVDEFITASTNVDQAKSIMDFAKESLIEFKKANPCCPTCFKEW